MSGPLFPLRSGDMTVAELIDAYFQQYAGRDSSRPQRLGWWRREIGHLRLDEVSDDHVHAALASLETQPARYYAGLDADGRPIFKAKRRTVAPATLNRYAASLGAVFTFAIKRRIAPKGWVHPCRGVERQPETTGRTRFLSEDERGALLSACRAAAWPRMYLLVLLALTTGARKGELLGLRWSDVDWEHARLHVGRSKNGDPKVLPLTPPASAELQRLRPPAGEPDALVFASARAKRKAFGFEPQWKDLLRQCGIRNFRFHDLRHSCASMLAANGATLLEIGDLLGHRQVSMTKRYSHLAAGHRQALVCRVMGDLR